MLRKLKHKTYSYYDSIGELTAFILPVILLILVIALGPSISKRFNARFDEDLFIGISEQEEEISMISSLIASGSADSINLIRRVLVRDMDLASIVLVLLRIGNVGEVLKALYILRFGLAGFFAYWLLFKDFKLRIQESILLSLCYSFSGAYIVSLTSTSCANLALLLPLCAHFTYGVFNKSSASSNLKLLITNTLLIMSGIYGITIGIVFELLLILFIAVDRKTITLRIIVTALSSLGLSLIVASPLLMSLGLKVDFVSNWEQREVRTTFFDLLVDFLPGLPLNIANDTVMGSKVPTVLLLVLVFLFFMGKSPLRTKLLALGFIVIYYASVAFSLISDSIYLCGERGFLENSATASFVLFLIMLGAIGFKMIPELNRREIFIVLASTFALFVISDNSKTITSRWSFFFISALLSIVLTGIYLLLYKDGKKPRIIIVPFVLIVIGIIIQATVSFCFSEISMLSSPPMDVEEVSDKTEAKFSLFENTSDTYLVLSSDISYASSEDIPSGINTICRAMMLEECLIDQKANLVYASGAISLEDGLFFMDEGVYRGEVIISDDQMDLDGTYVISVSSLGDNHITIMSEDVDTYYSFSNNGTISFKPLSTSVNIRLAITNAIPGDFTYRLWRLDEGLFSMVNELEGEIDGGKLQINDSPFWNNGVYKTVVTSYRWDSSYIVTSNGERLETYDYCGYLCFNTMNGDNISITRDVRDISCGAIVSLLSLIAYATLSLVERRKGRGLAKL